MAKNPVLTDDSRIEVTAAADFASGAFVVINTHMYGFAMNAGLTGEKIVLQRRGVFWAPKATGAGTDLAVGDDLEWDAANGVFEDVDAGAHVATVVEAAATTDARVKVVLV